MTTTTKIVIKKNGTQVPFDKTKILSALNKCFTATGKHLKLESGLDIANKVSNELNEEIVKREDIDKAVIKTLKKDPNTFEQAKEYEQFILRKKSLSEIQVISKNKTNSTDLSLLIKTSSNIEAYNPTKIRTNLTKQNIGLTPTEIEVISKHTEFEIADIYKKHKTNQESFALTTDMIRALVASTMTKMGYNPEVIIKSGTYGIPREDLEELIKSKVQENANTNSNNPSAISFGIKESILKHYALNEVFDDEIKEAHLKGEIHIHDLGYVTNVYCSAHSLAYIKKYGLKLDNINTQSSPPKEAIALSGLLSTFLASMQSYYAGALGITYLNLEFAPYIVDMDKKNLKKIITGIKKATSTNSELNSDLEKIVTEYSQIKKGVQMIKENMLNESEMNLFFSELYSNINDEKIIEKIKKFKSDYINIKNSSQVIIEDVNKKENELRNMISTISSNVENEKLLDKLNQVMEHYTDVKQIAQNLIFTQSQSAFSRGGQTLFIDFNLHSEVPKILHDVPIICPGGTYQICDIDGSNKENLERIIDKKSIDNLIYKDKEGDLIVNHKREFNRKLLNEKGKRFVTYKDYETEAQIFLDALLDIYYEGDAVGKMFAFPKCDMHVDENSFKHEKSKELLKKTCKIAAKNSSAYFIFDREAITVAACCRLKTSIEPKELEHPESMRFCGFQNITINLPQAAYRAVEKGRNNLDGLIEEVLSSMDLAYKAHVQKREFIETLMEPHMPLWQVAKNSLDGSPYINLDKATYIIGMIGLNEAIKVITGKEIHENEKYLQMGEQVIAAMYKKKEKYVKESGGWKFSIEESPAESASRNLAKRDINHTIYNKLAKHVIQGTIKDPYYTNSVHYRADAEGVTGIDRIKDLSRFHPLIESGAIIHLFTGESEMNQNSLFELVENTFENTMCNQFTVSGAHTSCKECNTQSRGFKKECPSCNSKNLEYTEKVVGYNSQLANWNASKVEEAKARNRGNYSIESSELKLKDEIILDQKKPYLKAVVYGKDMCSSCHELEAIVKEVIGKKEFKDIFEMEFIDLEKNDANCYENLARASRSGMNLSVIPALRIEYGQQNLNIPLESQKILSADNTIIRDPNSFKLVPYSENISKEEIINLLKDAKEIAKEYIKK